ncbi:UDP-4-amino-4,6-dideoxy-N-acetyl-beta-L-altrosamine N-acetyltransferase [uncultured Duncaniella sp.]|uniref:UDP-4-amino-4, 6-dideoxy-N-acetyl-beta-L-altrosamine N-acetyltransferase n=2 Tax=uncultured Duncaniella sp. TaxID=2768039 RepID=UPI00265A386E|nr:UDP-4-amino-4,6-dideoxy-N-acetyl-beta-L-altrosamine N-acetyltransferase [uncultured Duncaniella sp.]
MYIDKVKTYTVGEYSFVNFLQLDDETIENIRIWRNHPNIRKVMYNKDEISKEEHLSFIQYLNNTDSKLYWFVSKRDTPIGVISIFDIDEQSNRAELGYYLFPPNLNSGISVEFLATAHRFLFKEIGLQSVYGGTNINNTDAKLLNEYLGGKFGAEKALNGEIFIQHEITKERFLEREDGLENWRNFVRFCKKHPQNESH